MASGVTSESELGSIIEGHQDCPICFNSFREPKALSCLHIFCLKCLQELRQSQDANSGAITCPLCRCETMLEGKCVDDLPDQSALCAQVEEVAMKGQSQEGQGSEITCQACDEENQAISRCMDCEHFLCQACQKAHGHFNLMKSHKIVTLAQLRSGATPEDVPKCEKHPDQNLNVFCSTCEQLVCKTCSVQDHENHSLISLPEALDRCKHDVAELATKVEKYKAEFAIAKIETEMLHRKLDTMFARTNKKIFLEVARIREEECKLKQEAEKIYQDRVKTFEAAEATNSKEVFQAEQILHTADRLMARGTCYEILDLKQKLWHYHQELTEKEPEKVPESLSFLDFEEGGSSLGSLLEEKSELEVQDVSSLNVSPGTLYPIGNWKLIKEVTTFKLGEEQVKFKWAYDVAVFDNKELVTADIIHKVLIKTLNYYSDYMSTAGTQINGSSHVSASNDQLFTLVNCNYVMIYNSRYGLLHQFTPSKASNCNPSCLAVDDNNLVAVGYKGADMISLYSPHGSLIKHISTPMIDEHLTIYKQRLIYTNWARKRLLSVDYEGNKVFATYITCNASWWGPTGVCSDSNGCIYVAVCGKWPSPGEIQKYSPHGDYIGCVVKTCRTVYGITYYKHSNGYYELATAARESVKVYRLQARIKK